MIRKFNRKYVIHSLQCDAQLYKEFAPCLDKAHAWLAYTQIPENTTDYEKFYRHPNKVGHVFGFRSDTLNVSEHMSSRGQVLGFNQMVHKSKTYVYVLYILISQFNQTWVCNVSAKWQQTSHCTSHFVVTSNIFSNYDYIHFFFFPHRVGFRSARGTVVGQYQIVRQRDSSRSCYYRSIALTSYGNMSH